MSGVNMTEVRLLNVPLEKDYKHTAYFEDKATQTEFFNGCIVESENDFSYQRKDNAIRYPMHIDSLYSKGVNYVMYRNGNYSNKWFYAFITDMEYINDNNTLIHIKTDVIQTWLFDYEVKPSFVEREHTNDDRVGLNTVPEMVELGEFTCNELSRDLELRDYVYILQTTESTQGEELYATNYGGIWCSGGAYICKTGAELVSIVNLLSDDGKADAVFGVYLVPKKIVNNTSEDMKYSGQSEPVTYEHTFEKQTTLDGYTPRNKKLLTYPYNYILMSNNSGTSNILHYEDFSSAECEFEIAGVPSVGGSVKCSPLNYKGLERNQNEGIMLGKFPTCSWSADLYTNWLTQNAVNLGVGLASSGLQIVSGIGMMQTGAGAMSGASMVTSGALGVASVLGQVYQMSFTPNSAEGNTNGGDINTCYKMNTFYFYKMSIKSEYAKIIDGYFDMYGYKVNRVKTPNVNHRSAYWFTKTIDVNIDGAIPNNDLDEIKNCYNNGITFWKNGNITGYTDSVVKANAIV